MKKIATTALKKMPIFEPRTIEAKTNLNSEYLSLYQTKKNSLAKRPTGTLNIVKVNNSGTSANKTPKSA